MRALDQVEVSFEGIELPWLACAISVHGKTAVLQADQRPRYDAEGFLSEQLDVQPLFWLSKHPVVKDITRVVTSDFTTELLSRLIMDLVGQSPLAVAYSTALCHSRFATKYLLGGAHAIAPASRHLPLDMPRDPSDTVTFDLNAEQRACVDDVIAGNLISLTLGPPGAGKTTCIAAVAYNLAEGSRGVSDFPLVVVTTQQNVAALNVLRALLRRGYQNVKLVVGSGYYVEWHEHEYNEAELKHMHVPVPVGRFKLDDDEDSTPQKSWPQLAGERAITILTLGYVATLAKAVGDSSDIVPSKRVGSVLVDEASQAWNGHALILDQAFPNLQRLHLFGDDKQLPPVLSPKDISPLAAACNLGVRSMYDEARDGGKTHHFLQVQYRMPVKLAAFLSTQLYGGALRSAQGVSANDTDVVWLPVSSKHAYPTGSHSPYNETEARVVVKLASHIDKLGLKDYGWRHATCLVLTPYSAQRHCIERLCYDASEVRGGRWSIKTVDSFQGREADVVIVSLTKTSCGLGILRDLRRVNVMLSRVRKRLILVGHRSWLMSTDSLLWHSLATEFLVAGSFKELTSILGRRL